MKQRYAITIADMQMNIITDESAEAVEAIVGIIDRRIREIHLKSTRCSKTEAAMLCALDYCSEKIKAQRKVQRLEQQLADGDITIGELEETNAKLTDEIAELKKELSALQK